jgi:hypothetical protein
MLRQPAERNLKGRRVSLGPMSTPRPLPDVVTLADPRPGTVVGLAPGSQLCLRLRAGLGPTRWHIAAHPGNLVPLAREERELSFLVFDGAPATLRLERRHPRGDFVAEVRELHIEVVDAERRSA